MGKRWSIGVSLLALAGLSAHTAAAQSSPPSASGSLPAARQQHETYRRLKVLGNEALREERFEDALQLFLTAWASWGKDGSLACDIGRLYMRRGEHVPAARWLTRCVSLLADASTPEAVQRRRAEAVDLAVALARVTTLHLETEPGASLSIDGVDIGASPQSEPAFVEPGQHQVEAHKGSRRATAVIDGKAGETRRIPLHLLPAEPSLCDKPQPSVPPSVASPLRSAPEPSLPRPAPEFKWWPVYLGTTLTIIGVSSGTMLRIAADDNLERTTALVELINREKPGISCGNPAWWHPRCPERVRLDRLYVAYANASTAAFVVTGVRAAATIGFAAYETDRVTIKPTIGGLLGSFQW
jgi:hypothetical protein